MENMRLASVLLIVLAGSSSLADELPPAFHAARCAGTYPQHLQGVCTDERESIFWCFTTRLVKTDCTGKVSRQIDVASHHGDLCFQGGKVYAAVNLGKFNEADGRADSWVYAYNAGDLSLLAKHKTPELVFGAGGIAHHSGRFIVVGGLPAGANENNVYEYDADFKFVKQHRLNTGYTLKGIQTAAFADGQWWFGCYGDPKILLKADASWQSGQRFEFDCSLGIVPLGGGKFLVARGTSSKEKGCTGQLVLAEADDKSGLRLRE